MIFINSDVSRLYLDNIVSIVFISNYEILMISLQNHEKQQIVCVNQFVICTMCITYLDDNKSVLQSLLKNIKPNFDSTKFSLQYCRIDDVELLDDGEKRRDLRLLLLLFYVKTIDLDELMLIIIAEYL